MVQVQSATRCSSWTAATFKAGAAFKAARLFDPAEITPDFTEVTSWIMQSGASKLLVHVDLDVLDPNH